MAGTEQYPATQLVVGGQTALSGWDVLEEKVSFVEDVESYKDADGQHKVDIVYSRRKQYTLTLQAQHGTTVATYAAGGSLTHDSVSCRIVSFEVSKTRGPSMATMVLIAQADSL